MAYTTPAGLRDRQYASYTAINNAGSNTAIPVIIASGTANMLIGTIAISGNDANPIKTTDFTRSTCTTSAAGYFQAHTGSIFGEFKGISIAFNNFTDTGSLILSLSGTTNSYVIWSMISGTNTSKVDVSGLYVAKMQARDQNNQASGTNFGLSQWDNIPLLGVYRLLGSSLGNATTCSGISIIYK